MTLLSVKSGNQKTLILTGTNSMKFLRRVATLCIKLIDQMSQKSRVTFKARHKF